MPEVAVAQQPKKRQVNSCIHHQHGSDDLLFGSISKSRALLRVQTASGCTARDAFPDAAYAILSNVVAL